jgi:CheY-like chemotaxis protein
MTKINSIGIIDDDPITVFGIKKILNSLDICSNISAYANGKEAIDGIRELIAKNQAVPEVIFLDINMPIMDGWQFLEEFISLPLKKRIRINIVTSSIDPLDKQNWEYYKSRTQHILDFKNKPLGKKELSEITKAA